MRSLCRRGGRPRSPRGPGLHRAPSSPLARSHSSRMAATRGSHPTAYRCRRAPTAGSAADGKVDCIIDPRRDAVSSEHGYELIQLELRPQTVASTSSVSRASPREITATPPMSIHGTLASASAAPKAAIASGIPGPTWVMRSPSLDANASTFAEHAHRRRREGGFQHPARTRSAPMPASRIRPPTGDWLVDPGDRVAGRRPCSRPTAAVRPSISAPCSPP